MLIKTFAPFVGRHCETTATGSLLHQLGLTLSEPMMFGLGEGLGFIFWKMKFLDFPFIGGRTKSMAITEKLAKNLNLTLEVQETTSVRKAWQNVVGRIEQGQAVGLQLDCYHLEYFGVKIHFAGHFVAMYGFDDKFAYLVDTCPNGGKVKTLLKNLELARSEKGSMAAKNLMYCLSGNSDGVDLSEAIKTAVVNNATAYLNPPVKNFGYKGILKTSVEIKKWFKTSKDVSGDFSTTAMLMNEAGTGGAIFRNIYRDFLQESYAITQWQPLQEAYLAFKEIAEHWTQVANLFEQAGQTNKIEHINLASEILVELSEKEYAAMTLLKEMK